MNLQNLLNQFLGGHNVAQDSRVPTASGFKEMATNLSNKMGDLGTGAAVGGIAALLVSSKKARSFAGSAAMVGGAALLGGLAFKAFKNWQRSKLSAQSTLQQSPEFSQARLTQSVDTFENEVSANAEFQLTLVKAMIAAAKADGHIDDVEQSRIFDAVEEMPSSSDFKYMMMDLLRYPSSIKELVCEVKTVEQKSELYLISCFAIDVDHEAESQYLSQLASALGLPSELAFELRQQADHAVLQAA
ncbi:tellurite resistance TerB family protein [Pseudomonas sp. HK3]